MSTLINLPAGWAALPLRAVCELGKARVWPSEAGDLPYVGLEHIVRDGQALAGFGHATDTTSLKSRFMAGDVLYGRLRPNLNKVVVAPWDGMASTDIVILRPNALIKSDYLLNILASNNFVDYAVSRAKGTNLPRLSTESLLDYVAAIPPISAQERTLDALGVQMIGLRSIRDKLQQVRRLADKALPKILAAAVEGRLTQVWRRKNAGGSVANLPSSEGDNDAAFPPEWERRTVGDAGSAQEGRPRRPKHHQGDNMRPYLRVANVLEGRFDLSDVMAMNFTPAEFERYRLRWGDILINEGQSLELVGRPAMFREEMDAVAFTNTLIRFQCGPDIVPEFAEVVFRHYLHAGVFRDVAKISTNLAHLGVGRLLSLPFPVPSIEEQRLIAKTAQDGLDQLERARTMLTQISYRIGILAERLRMQALAGELVSVDPEDEPVFKALERLGDGTATPAAVEVKRKYGRPKIKSIRSLVETLNAATGGLSGQELFDQSGYPEDAGTDTVERFYLELRSNLEDGRIERREVAGAELFLVGAGKDVDR